MALHSSTLAWKRSLVGCSPWGCEESDTTENPRDGGAWWAAVYGVAQNWTRLKRLSSSSSSSRELFHALGFHAFNFLLVPQDTAPGLPGHLVQMWDREVRQSGGAS